MKDYTIQIKTRGGEFSCTLDTENGVENNILMDEIDTHESLPLTICLIHVPDGVVLMDTTHAMDEEIFHYVATSGDVTIITAWVEHVINYYLLSHMSYPQPYDRYEAWCYFFDRIPIEVFGGQEDKRRR